ncbi:MAG: hypothetical protein KJ571_04475 [Bacteroidetes bacterium]|nr:hypothetical protein [Bacteroidota bacterium]
MNNTSLPLFIIFSILIFSSLNSQPLKENADKEFTDGNYIKSAELFNEYLSTEENKKDGQAWQSLAFSYYQLENYEEALNAFLKSEEHEAPVNIRSIVQTGISYLKMKNKEKAYEYLDKAVTAGLPPRLLKSNNRLDEINNEEKFQKLLSKAEENAFPCRNNPLNRQFDFWLGDWQVYANGQYVANSKIEYSLEGCLIIENYEAFSGYSGKSINFYDAGDKIWQQIWTDISGNVSRYSGELKDGKMYLWGENIDKAGSKSLVRMEFTPNDDGSVRQLYEGSNDGGKTWSIYFDGLYKKKQ